MKKITASLLTLIFTLPSAAYANDVMVAASMQRCTTNEECALVTNSCQDNCGFVPVNKENLTALQGQYQARCGKAMEANPTCTTNPPLAAACINARCTIDYAHINNSSAGDYKAGAYGVPEAPAPDKVPAQAYKGVDDTKGGFTAYNLPQTEVKQNTVGTIYDRIYVPPSAPVSGGNYVPVGQSAAAPVSPAPAPAMAPTAPAPIPPIAVPTNKTHATPTVVTPAAPVPTPPPAPMPTPQAAMPVPATPAPVIVPNGIPAMTPSAPNQPAAPIAAPAPAPVAAPTTYVPSTTQATGPAIPSIGATGVPVAPPGSTPIPPSDLQPVPTFVPPPGGTIPVNPEDPGAPPPEGSTIMMKDGKLGMTTTTETTVKTKSFTATAPSESKAKKTGSFN